MAFSLMLFPRALSLVHLELHHVFVGDGCRRCSRFLRLEDLKRQVASRSPATLVNYVSITSSLTTESTLSAVARDRKSAKGRQVRREFLESCSPKSPRRTQSDEQARRHGGTPIAAELQQRAPCRIPHADHFCSFYTFEFYSTPHFCSVLLVLTLSVPNFVQHVGIFWVSKINWVFRIFNLVLFTSKLNIIGITVHNFKQWAT